MPLRTVRVMKHLGARCRHTVISLDGVMSAAEHIPQSISVNLVPLVQDKGRVIGNLLACRRFIARTKPDYILILPWNLKDEITKQLAYARDWGAKFVVPIPEVAIL